MERHQIEQKTAEENLFQQTVQPYIRMMRRLCLAFTGSVWDGDDLFQIAMMKLYKAWKASPSRPVTKAYVYRIISNAWIDGHRKVSIDEVSAESMDDFTDQGKEKEFDERFQQAMKRLVNCLPAKQRLIFLLMAGLNCRAAEVSELTGESEGNIRVAYHRAKKRLEAGGESLLPSQNDKLADLYVEAFQSLNPEKLFRLYQYETGTELYSGATGSVRMMTLRMDQKRIARWRIFPVSCGTIKIQQACRRAA
ncbi:sigma-70 family RNA polymerase sigma factor [Sporolactobacillus sp. THM7-4]|nr:sigma-70 family RNA polymerase sigma factor [Sporolactobacillus sp. THM7-4]